MQDRIVQGAGLYGQGNLGLGQAVNGIDPDDPDLVHGQAEFALDLVGGLVALGIGNCLAQSHFDSDRHAVLLDNAYGSGCVFVCRCTMAFPPWALA